MIGTLRNFDFSQSYAYFQLNEISATAGAVVDAKAAIAMQTTVQPLQIDLDPWGGSFNLKGLWEIGPYMEVTAQIQAQATISGKISSNSTIISTAGYTWMYPATLSSPPSETVLEEFYHNFKVTSGESASISIDGSLTMSLTPAVGFRIALNALGSSLVNTDIKAKFSSAMTVNVGASTSGCSGAYYGISGTLNAGFEMTDPLPGWSVGQTTYDVLKSTWEVQPMKCFPWNTSAKRGLLESRASSVVDALFPDISALNIACTNDITSTSSGCGEVILDNSDIFGADSTDQGVIPTVTWGTTTKRNADESEGTEDPGNTIPGFSSWSDGPDYDLTQSLHQLSKRESSKEGFLICSGLRPVFFAGFYYWSGSDLINQKAGTPAVPTAYTKSDDCDTYGVSVDPNPTVRNVEDGNNRYYIAEHVLEWKLLQDFWLDMLEQFGTTSLPNPRAPGFLPSYPQTAAVSWCDYMYFWWNRKQVTLNGIAAYPVWHAGAGVIPSKDNGYANELVLLDTETNGFKERLFGEGSIRVDAYVAEWNTDDPDKAVLVCRAAMNSVTYMKLGRISTIYLTQAQRVADKL